MVLQTIIRDFQLLIIWQLIYNNDPKFYKLQNCKQQDKKQDIQQRMIKQYDYLFKVVLVGNSSVGKSSLLQRFADDSFKQSYLATIGVDFRFKTITVQGNIVKLQIWDTAGQQRFRTITGSYYKGAHAIIVVYDITKPQSFQDIQQYWLGEIQKNQSENTQIFIVGNKIDAEDKKVQKETVQLLCKSKGIQSMQVSAKNGDNVSTLFYKVSEQLTRTNPKQQRRNQLNPVIDDIRKKKKDFKLQSGAQTVKRNSGCCLN